MDSLNVCVREYTAQLKKGKIQKACRGIMSFLTGLMSHLEEAYPGYSVSALYPGYMDMTYFAFTPPELKSKQLKIALVYLHEECRFELWLAANNRRLQGQYIELLRQKKDTGGYTLSQAAPGVDSILSFIAVENPDFDRPQELKQQLEEAAVKFSGDIAALLG